MMKEHNVTDLLESLGKALIDAPNLAMMIVDEKMNIVWFNEAHGRLTGSVPDESVGRKCYELTQSEKSHQGCPTQVTLKEGIVTQSLWDFADVHGYIVTLPLPGGYVAKVMSMIPKEPSTEIQRF